MMAPKCYQEMLDAAPIHLQLRVTERRLIAPPDRSRLGGLRGDPEAGIGTCTLTGEIVRIFRDRAAALQPGATVSIALPCAYEHAEIPMGGTVYQDVPALEAETFVEAIPKEASGGFQRLAGSGMGMKRIDAPSETPAIERLDRPAGERRPLARHGRGTMPPTGRSAAGRTLGGRDTRRGRPVVTLRSNAGLLVTEDRPAFRGVPQDGPQRHSSPMERT